MIRDGGRTGHFLFSKEGVTQGYPLLMIVYGLRVLLLVRELQILYPKVM